MAEPEIKTINPKKLQAGDLILDVRTESEVSEKYLAMPFLHEDSTKINIDDCIRKYNLTGCRTLNILCGSGKRATEVAKKFIEKGFTNVKVVEGGLGQAEKEGLKIIKK
ncbi:MAG TPA: rhodanese-like domain-containing protein [Rickettsiales bacterium]|nr:rhodanese-like domain-containing protein [Rickettsiales bacterium]